MGLITMHLFSEKNGKHEANPFKVNPAATRCVQPHVIGQLKKRSLTLGVNMNVKVMLHGTIYKTIFNGNI